MKNCFALRILAAVAFLYVSPFAHANKNRQTDSIFIEKTLKEALQNHRIKSLPLYFANKFIHTPYVAHTLEVNDREQLVVNTRQLDCTTLVENVTALCMCMKQRLYDFAAFKENLQAIRYRNGVIGDYCSRLHYFSEWISDNRRKGIVTVIEKPHGLFSSQQTLDLFFMSRYAHKYQALEKHPEYIAEISSTEQAVSGEDVRFLHKDSIGNNDACRSAIHDGDIIAITTSKKGLDIAHVGFAVWKKNGLHLINASQKHKKVVLESMTLKQYLEQHPSHTGIRVIRIMCD
ncbi:MAG: N-acetylmuramoyl-L-alanine amidase-like domain-containing protein [Prevotella sp.]